MKKQQSEKALWPTWFPYPSSWLRSLVLALWLSIVLRIGLFWGVSFGVIYFGITKRSEPLLWFIGLALMTSFTLFSYTHHFLWGKSSVRYPRWLPSPKSLWEGLYAAIVMAVAIIVSFGCVLPFHNFESNQMSTLEEEGKWFTVIWLISATYLYQAEYLIKKKIK